MAPKELLIIYVVRSRIGNSPRHFSSSSISQSSIGNLVRPDLSPHKVAQRNEHKPGDPCDQRDAQTGYPPSRNQYCSEPDESENRTPRSARSKAHRRLRPLRGMPAKRKVRDKDHLPDKNAPEECRPQHVYICFGVQPMI